MASWLIESLRHHPEIALFLVLALGYGLGSVRIGTFRLGPVLGVLIAGIVVGQCDVPTSETLKSVLFMLFLLAVGYRSGPLFFRSLRATALPQVALTFAVCVTALLLALLIARLAGFDAGAAAGLFAGAMTGSAAFGAAGEAIMRLNASEQARQLLQANAAVAFAVCYMIGTVLVVWVLTTLGPKIMNVDLPAACRELETELGMRQEERGVASANVPFFMRAYEIPAALAGRSVAELERQFDGRRFFVQRLRRDGAITAPTSDLQLRAGDRVALWAQREALIGPANPLSAHEVDDGELVDVGIVALNAVVTRREAGRTLGELARNPAAAGVFLRTLRRAGAELPFTPQTVIERGDVLSLSGEKAQIDRLLAELGYAQLATDATDMLSFSTAIFVGALIGLPRSCSEVSRSASPCSSACWWAACCSAG
jgi:putative transport protein